MTIQTTKTETWKSAMYCVTHAPSGFRRIYHDAGKYPQGKPEETLDPDYFCPQFAVTELDFDSTGEESHG